MEDAYSIARRLTINAVNRGGLVKQPCEVCGNEKTVAHHDDYNYPLSIRWLCRKHHNAWHRQHGPARGRFWFDREWLDSQGQTLFLGDVIQYGRARWRVVQSMTRGHRELVRVIPC